MLPAAPGRVHPCHAAADTGRLLPCHVVVIISLRIGPALILPATRQLFLEGVEQRLGGRAFDLLLALARHPDGVVSKEMLYESVWQGCAVEPNNLQVQVWALRRLLGERAIATVPRRGYRLTLPVQTLASGTSLGAQPQPQCERLGQAISRLQSTRWVTLVAADVGERRWVLRQVREANAAMASTVWHWRGHLSRAWDAALWHRVNVAEGLVIAEDLDEGAAAWLRDRVAQLRQGGPRILASSARPLAAVADTLLDVSGMAGTPEAVAGAATLGRRPRLWDADRQHCDSAK